MGFGVWGLGFRVWGFKPWFGFKPEALSGFGGIAGGLGLLPRRSPAHGLLVLLVGPETSFQKEKGRDGALGNLEKPHPERVVTAILVPDR